MNYKYPTRQTASSVVDGSIKFMQTACKQLWPQTMRLKWVYLLARRFLVFYIFIFIFLVKLQLMFWWWDSKWTPDRLGVIMCITGVFPEGESGPDNGCQLGYRGRHKRPVRQTRSPAGSERPRRGKPEQSGQTVHRLWSCWGNSFTEDTGTYTARAQTCWHCDKGAFNV